MQFADLYRDLCSYRYPSFPGAWEWTSCSVFSVFAFLFLFLTDIWLLDQETENDLQPGQLSNAKTSVDRMPHFARNGDKSFDRSHLWAAAVSGTDKTILKSDAVSQGKQAR